MDIAFDVVGVVLDRGRARSFPDDLLRITHADDVEIFCVERIGVVV